MSGSLELEDVADLATRTGLSEKEVLEIIELVGPHRSSVIREAAMLKREIARAESEDRDKAH